MALCLLSNIPFSSTALFPFPLFHSGIDEDHDLNWPNHCRASWRGLALVCSAKKPRAAKKAKLSKLSKPNMTDSDLCNELREFVAAEGLPENRIPSMTELSKRGRKDLANIVRRRGYKVIMELLKNQSNDIDAHSEINLSGNQDSSNNDFDKLPGVQGRSSDVLSEVEDYVRVQNGVADVSAGDQSSEALEPLVGMIHGKVKLSQNEVDPSEDAPNEDPLNESEMNRAILSLNGSETGSVIPQGTTSFSPQQHCCRDDLSLCEGLSSANSDADDVSASGEADKQTEIVRLKAMLHQKEVELSLLKQEIEKGKLALSALQNKWNAEMDNVQSDISAKDAELCAAEEDLVGLKEVRIEYRGYGEIVEVTGSFNGWHHQIKMDPQSSSNSLNLTEMRDSNLWFINLWLYPGIYEIKFVVDGQWRIDPERELITRGHIANNILKVER